MASKEALRVWCDGDWPEDGFTLDENVADLAGHLEDAEAGTAYGYTMWDPTGTRAARTWRRWAWSSWPRS